MLRDIIDAIYRAIYRFKGHDEYFNLIYYTYSSFYKINAKKK